MDKRSIHGFTGTIVTPLDPDYNELRQGYNRAVQKYPAAICYCNSAADVAAVIRWARHRGKGLRVRGGGHNYEGFSSGDGVVVIDVSRLNQLSLSDGLLTVGGGVRLRALYDYVSSRGYPFPGGTCPTVGVGGYALGGGWGLSCRWLGLGCDSLRSLELVTAAGELLTASAHNNSDLFWACRGAGGGNFGVVVSMTFRMPPKTGNVTLINFEYTDTDAQKQADFLHVWQTWLEKTTNRVTLVARIYHTPNLGFAIAGRGILYGTPQKAERILAPLVSLGSCQLELEYLPFLQAINRIEQSYPSAEKFKSAGRFVVTPLTPEQIHKTVALIQDVPEGSVWNGLSLYALGGKTTVPSSHSTAFFYRNARYILGLQSIWEEEQYAKDNREWVEEKYPTLCSVTTGSYVNFPYTPLPCFAEAYFGENVPRLKKVKEKYDPDNVFQFPQSIP